MAVAAPATSDTVSTSEAPGSRAAVKLLIAVALALTVLRLVIARNTGLVDDEAYYRVWSLAPALSYLDHPPMVAWLIGAGRVIAGDNPLGVRLLGPLISLVGAAFLWRTALILYGPEVARRAVWFLLAMPLLAVGAIVITPDLPSVLFAGLAMWALAELDRSQNAKWWLAIGLFAGLGLLSKYTNLFLGGSIAVWLLATPENRKWFRAPELWLGGFIAAAVASPVAIWNAEHGWASFAKQFGRVGHSGPAGLNSVLEFIGGFAALESPLIAILALIGFIGVVRRAFTDLSRNDVLLASVILPMFAYFCVHGLHDRVQGNWPAPLYPSFAICAALGIEALPVAWRRATFIVALCLGFALSALIYAHALQPLLQSAKDPTEQMRGWPALADAIEKKRAETGAAWVTTSSYATTGQLMFALKDRSPVAQLDDRIRYIFLPPLPESLLEKPALYVELERRVQVPLLRQKFRRVEEVGTLKRANGSPDGATYILYLVAEPLAPPLAMDDKP